jgi:hypothetical protein
MYRAIANDLCHRYTNTNKHTRTHTFRLLENGNSTYRIIARSRNALDQVQRAVRLDQDAL